MSFPSDEIISQLQNNIIYRMVWLDHPIATEFCHSEPLRQISSPSSSSSSEYGLGEWAVVGKLVSTRPLPISHRSPGRIAYHDWPLRPDRAGYKIDTKGFGIIHSGGNNSPGIPMGNCAVTYQSGDAGIIEDYGIGIKKFLDTWQSGAWDVDIIEKEPPYRRLTPLLPPRRILYLGTASPPPPLPRSFPPSHPRKKMQCCSCNDVATIVENQSILQLRAQEKLFENFKDHIDKRALEIIIKDLEHLKALDFEQFLKAILQRVNEIEANLWNGAPR